MLSGTSRYAARLPLWVLIGGCLGVLTGLFFGDDAAVLKPIGTIYVRLLEVAVVPYITCSLLHGLGRMSPGMARRLLRCSWLVYLAVWGLTLLIIFVMTLSIPPAPPPSFIDARTQQDALGLMELLIPANPFLDLTRNYLPAIVIFSIIYGIAIHRVRNQEKEAFLSFLALIRTASVTIWGWVVLLAPFGVFALFAHTAGTVALAELAELSIYLVAIVLGTLLLAFWVLPTVAMAFCPMAGREIVRDLQNALIISLVTSLSVAALPFIQQAAEKLVRQKGIEDENASEIIQTTLVISYPLAQLGNFFVWLFILFAAFYFRVPISVGDQLALPFVTLLSGFGSPTSSIGAVTFIAQWLSMPAETTDLYVGMMSITRYVQVVVSVMGFAFVTFLVTMTYYGRIRLRLPRLAGTLAAGAAIVGVASATVWIVQGQLVAERTDRYMSYRLLPRATEGVNVVIEKSAPARKPPTGKPPTGSTRSGSALSGSILQRIQRSGEIRIGFNPHVIPFSYRNERGELVGYDIAFAYKLAHDLNVRLRLIPFDWNGLEQDLAERRFDLALSGLYVTNRRLRKFALSDPYLKSSIAFIVRADAVNRFLSRAAINARDDLTVAVFRDPVMSDMVKRLIPKAKVVVLPSYDALAGRPDIDAALWTLMQAKAWTARRPAFTAVVPKGLGGDLMMAYLMPEDSSEFRAFVNYWLRVQRVSGFSRQVYRRWIEGKPEPGHVPRWSILRNVLNRAPD